jgi:hypothetical protein
MAIIKIDGRSITNHWMLLQDTAGNTFERTDIAPSYPSPNWYFNGGLDFPTTQPIPTFNLPDGTYIINPQGGSNFTFTVSGGNVGYGADCAAFLSGAGTNTLVLKGFTVTFDARYLIGNGLVFWGVLGYGAGDPKGNGDKLVIHRTCTLLPGSNYYFVVGSGLYGDFFFNVEKDGKLTMDSKYALFMRIKTPNTLVIEGFPILIDGRKNGTAALAHFGVYSMWDADLPDNHSPWSTSKVIIGNFVPTWIAHGYFPLKSPTDVSSEGFRVAINGTVSVSNPTYLKVDTFNGIRRVTVLKTLP